MKINVYGCHCGSSHFTILPNGYLYACRRMESKVGNIFEKEILIGGNEDGDKITEAKQRSWIINRNEQISFI